MNPTSSHIVRIVVPDEVLDPDSDTEKGKMKLTVPGSFKSVLNFSNLKLDFEHSYYSVVLMFYKLIHYLNIRQTIQF